jgi:hypothetical protein
MSDKPVLMSSSFIFCQEGNCVDGGHEELELRCEASLGIYNDGECFYILKTEQWAIDNIDDLKELLDRVGKVIKKAE